MPSFIGRPASLENTGALIRMQLWVPQGIANELGWQKKLIAPPLDAVGIVDTGASMTIIQEGIAGRLGLTPTGVTTISTPISANHECYQYQIRLLFPQGIATD